MHCAHTLLTATSSTDVAVVNDVSVSAKLLEGQAIQLEDGTTAFVQAPPKGEVSCVND